MNRRAFLISAGIIGAFASVPFLREPRLPKPVVLRDAYSLWYNRPAVAQLAGGFCLGYLTSSGEIAVAELTDRLLIRRVRVLHKFDHASDHGSPSLVRIPSGKYAGRILACFSNHSSPLLCARTIRAEDAWSWSTPQMIDGGRATYASLAALPDGGIILMHTLQERIGNYDAGEWRRVVARVTKDGGDTWTDPVVIAGFGAGTFPYSTALSVARDGRCAMAYAIYSNTEKKHQGLAIVVSKDAFKSKIEINIDLGSNNSFNTVPYETRWTAEDVISVSYTQMSNDGSQGLSRVVSVNAVSGAVLSNVEVGHTAVHTYAGGAAIDHDGHSVITSPVYGGLVRHDLATGKETEIVASGAFSSPWIFSVQGNPMLMALRNPLIKTTRDFGGEIYLAPLR